VLKESFKRIILLLLCFAASQEISSSCRFGKSMFLTAHKTVRYVLKIMFKSKHATLR